VCSDETEIFRICDMSTDNAPDKTIEDTKKTILGLIPTEIILRLPFWTLIDGSETSQLRPRL
jgi:hypothetical protein